MINFSADTSLITSHQFSFRRLQSRARPHGALRNFTLISCPPRTAHLGSLPHADSRLVRYTFRVIWTSDVRIYFYIWLQVSFHSEILLAHGAFGLQHQSISWLDQQIIHLPLIQGCCWSYFSDRNTKNYVCSFLAWVFCLFLSYNIV